MSNSFGLSPAPTVSTEFNYRFPTHSRVEIEGMPVFLVDLPTQFITSVYLVINTPLSLEPAAGIASLTANCVDEGTTVHQGSSLAEALDDHGAAFETALNETSTIACLSVPTSHLREALNLFAEIVTSPALENDDIERMKALRSTQISQVAANSSASADRGLQMAIFQDGSRLNKPKGGLLADIAKINQEQVRSFHQNWWGGLDAKLIIAGQLPENIEYLVKDAFSSWNRQLITPKASPASPNTDQHIWVIDRPESVQADIRIGGFGIDRRDERWPAFRVASSAVGGSFLSRLNRVLREERGYTYGVHFSASPLLSGGSYRMSGSFRTEVAGQALSEALNILDISNNALSEQEVANAKSYMLGVAPLRYDTAEAIAAQTAALISAGLEPNYIDQYHLGLQQVTASSANEAFTSIVKTSQAQIVICGDASTLMPQLAHAGFDAQIIQLSL